MATRRTALGIASFFLLLASQLLAEGLTIKGVVVDPSGAVLPKAKLILVDLRTLETMQTTTNNEGQFSFELQRTGRYALIAGGQPCFLSEVKIFRWKRTPSPLKLQLRFDPECKFVE